MMKAAPAAVPGTGSDLLQGPICFKRQEVIATTNALSAHKDLPAIYVSKLDTQNTTNWCNDHVAQGHFEKNADFLGVRKVYLDVFGYNVTATKALWVQCGHQSSLQKYPGISNGSH